MRLPIRIHRRRARGWKMPAHTKYVGRGSLYGNPFRVARSSRELEEGGELIVASPADAARDVFIARAAEDMKYLLDLVEQHESEGKQS